MRKRLVALAVVVLGVLASVTAAQADPGTTVPFDQVIAVPCANGGLGENVHFTGDEHIVTNLTINGNNFNVMSHFNIHATGIGLTTGDAYLLNHEDNFTASFSLQNDLDVQTQAQTFNVVGQGSASNFKVIADHHFTINANGDVTADHTTIEADCK